MSKGIAIRTILLLLIGIITVSVIIYLIYSYTSSPVLSKTECMAIVTNWCTNCMISGWDENIDCTDEVKACGGMILGNDWWINNNNCADGGPDGDPAENLKTDCRVTVGVG